MAVIDPNPAKGAVTRTLKEHLGIAVALKIPTFFVINKIDSVTRTSYNQAVQKIKELLLMHVLEMEDVKLNGVVT